MSIHQLVPMHCVLLFLSTLALVATVVAGSKGAANGVDALPSTTSGYDVFGGILKQTAIRLNAVVKKPEQALDLLDTFHKNQGLHPHGLHAMGRERVMTYLFSLIESFDGLSIYVGTEQGEYFTYFPTEAVYREPGNSGYLPHDPEMSKYWGICVNGKDGSEENCQMNEGDSYVQCVDDCKLVECPGGEISDCSSEEDEDCKKAQAESMVKKWCPDYTIEQVGPTSSPSDNNTETWTDIPGFVPVSYHCIDELGRFSWTPGEVMVFTDDDQDETKTRNNGTCKHRDNTPVTRVISGPFASCQEHGEDICNSTYTAVIRTVNYDPRVRPWYIGTKEKQKPNWNSPYPFHSWRLHSPSHIGITFSRPYYSMQTTTDTETEKETVKQVFEGVLAVDYTLLAISRVLIDDFGNANDIVVMVFEEAEPYNVVGLSTENVTLGQGNKVYRGVLKSDNTVLCTPEQQEQDECEQVRVPATDLRSVIRLDRVAERAVRAHADAGFPTGERVPIKETDDFFSASYVSQTVRYAHAGMEWVILVASPVERVHTDALRSGDASFVILIIIAVTGTLCCFALFGLWYHNKEKRSVKHGDFYFTSAFIAGCALLNMSSFVSLGENSDAMCMARMWTFNACFSLVLAPLYAKVFRIHRVLGAASRMKRHQVTFKQTALWCIPIVAIQLVILIIFTFVDPPVAHEKIAYGSTVLKQSIECASETNAFLITQGLYSSSLVAVGCVLAFLTRNLDSRFGEARQLLYGMYNIAFTGICFIFLFAFGDSTPAALHTFRAVAIFWGTVLTCGVFVLPRLFQLRDDAQASSTGLHISGLVQPGISGSAHICSEPLRMPSQRPELIAADGKKSESAGDPSQVQPESG